MCVHAYDHTHKAQLGTYTAGEVCRDRHLHSCRNQWTAEFRGCVLPCVLPLQAKNHHAAGSQGRWPSKSAEILLQLLKNAESNADVKVGTVRC